MDDALPPLRGWRPSPTHCNQHKCDDRGDADQKQDHSSDSLSWRTTAAARAPVGGGSCAREPELRVNPTGVASYLDQGGRRVFRACPRGCLVRRNLLDWPGLDLCSRRTPNASSSAGMKTWAGRKVVGHLERLRHDRDALLDPSATSALSRIGDHIACWRMQASHAAPGLPQRARDEPLSSDRSITRHP